MKISYNWLNEYLSGKAPTPEKVGELLTMHSMEIESMEKIGDDIVMDAKTTPNLNHSCLCHRGVAREIGVISDIKVNRYSRNFKDFNIADTEKKLEIKIADEKKCRRYIGRIIENIKAGESPKWLKEKLEVIGQRSINNIVDATNFVMNEIGQPMHAFDADKLAKDGQILIEVKNCKSNDHITTLDKKEVDLDESVLAITSSDIPLAIAGIKGGIYAELEENTKNIVLESANFNPVLIRKTAQKLKIQTDASKRYENDYSPEMADEAMDILTKIIVEIAGTKDIKIGKVIDIYPRRAKKYKLGISNKEASDIIGVKITDKDIENIFNRFNFEFEIVKPIEKVLETAKSLVGVPYRLGASISYDAPKVFDCSGFTSYCFSEAGIQIPRISVDQYVFGKLISKKEILPGDIIFSNTGEGQIHYKTSEFLPNTEVPEGVDHCGLYLGDGEVIHATHLFDKVVIEDLDKSERFKNIVGYRRMSDNEERFVITVPDERLDLRIKEDLAEEIGRIYGYEKIGEVSTKFEGKAKINKDFYYKEKIRRILNAQGFSEIINYTFTDKGEIELENSISPEKRFLRTNLTDGFTNSLEFNARYSELVEMPQIKVFEFGHIFTNKGEYRRFVIGVKNPIGLKKPKEQDILSETILVLEKELGVKLNRLNSENNIAEFDFNGIITELSEPEKHVFSELTRETKYFKKISQYPFMIRDVAVFTPEGTKAEEVLEIIKKEAGKLAVKNRLFDVFTKRFEDGSQKISYAYRLIFQSYDRTLTDVEVNVIMDNITKKLNTKVGWQVR
jgi:phenylalanyl-tRNA synthetase beta subunit